MIQENKRYFFRMVINFITFGSAEIVTLNWNYGKPQEIGM